jgi:ornithine--oxo-acid transaminase
MMGKLTITLHPNRAVNQGHCHPKILKALQEQARNVTLSSRAFYNSQLGPFAELMTKMFGFDMVLPMNTGVEAVETGLKLARKWAYLKKGVPEGEAVVLAAAGNFHGRSLAVIRYETSSFEMDPVPYHSTIPIVNALL